MQREIASLQKVLEDAPDPEILKVGNSDDVITKKSSELEVAKKNYYGEDIFEPSFSFQVLFFFLISNPEVGDMLDCTPQFYLGK